LHHGILEKEGQGKRNPKDNKHQVKDKPECCFFNTFAIRFLFQMSNYILGIESSCDDTSAAVLQDTRILSNEIANQNVHSAYGGVVPELASRAHQQNIIPVVDIALRKAKIAKNQLNAIAFTRGPGLLGSLLVGTSFAKSFAMGLGIPIIEVDHLKAHILSHFIVDEDTASQPAFPFLCLTVSGGHTQIVRVNSPSEMVIIGTTLDDAAGEAFDKAAKIMGLPYPGGPVIDKLAKSGDPNAFSFPKPKIPGLDYSFSGLKTSFLYFLRDKLKENEHFIEDNKEDLSASLQKTIINILLQKLKRAARETNIREIAIAGGVSANSGLRQAITELAAMEDWNTYIPKLQYSTDNAAMIAIAGYFKFLDKDFTTQEISPYSKNIGF
jgi:N6-L-threonylcarbamoyladenine synthase